MQDGLCRRRLPKSLLYLRECHHIVHVFHLDPLLIPGSGYETVDLSASNKHPRITESAQRLFVRPSISRVRTRVVREALTPRQHETLFFPFRMKTTPKDLK